MIKACINILHADLSYNGFSPSDAQIISEILEENHNTYGIHFEGNVDDCFIDSLGFLKINTDTFNSIKSSDKRKI